MKKFLCSFLFMILCISAYAGPKENAVEMVEFEQRAYDSNSSISLKNNTEEEIHNVTFQITYIDMKGRELDYKEYAEEIEIAPGKTKRLEIPAYERDRQYEYYKSRSPYLSYPAFKVKFELKTYNSTNLVTNEEEEFAQYNRLMEDLSRDSYETSDSGSMFVLIFIAAIVIFGAYIGLYFLVASMARNRNRDAAVWLIVAIIGSPILAIIILLMAGDNNNTDGF